VTKALKTSGLDAAMSRANDIAGFTSLDQFRKHMGPEFDKFERETESKIPDDTPPEARQQLEQEQIVELKKAFKRFYAEYVQKIGETTPGIEDEVSNALTQLNKLG
jgi:hypothetical protein